MVAEEHTKFRTQERDGREVDISKIEIRLMEVTSCEHLIHIQLKAGSVGYIRVGTTIGIDYAS
jgi:hypothetical protein